MLIGAHMSIGKGILNGLKDALSIGATTMQIFTRNPRGGRAKNISLEEAHKAKKLMEELEFGPWVAHAPYTINLASSKDEVRKFGIEIIKEDFIRMEQLGAKYLVIHGGSHGGQGDEKGLTLLKAGLDQLLEVCPPNMELLLEMMAGQGSELCYKFEQLRQIIDSVEDSKKLGICLDTCHLFAAGYDIRDWAKIWSAIENTIGGSKVKVLHLNDSKTPLGSKRDRHAPLGQGEIGEEAIKQIILHVSGKHIPVILETPNDLAGWGEEIGLIRRWLKAC